MNLLTMLESESRLYKAESQAFDAWVNNGLQENWDMWQRINATRSHLVRRIEWQSHQEGLPNYTKFMLNHYPASTPGEESQTLRRHSGANQAGEDARVKVVPPQGGSGSYDRHECSRDCEHSIRVEGNA